MIHLIVGNTGAGKTTYSNQLKEKVNGIIFSIDKWNKTLFFPDKKESDGLEWILERIERAENMIMHLIEQLETAKVDSILDVGLATLEHREKFRNFAATHGFKCQMHYLDIPKAVRYARVQKRNQEKGASFEFEVTEEMFEFMETWFQIPSPAELESAHIIKS